MMPERLDTLVATRSFGNFRDPRAITTDLLGNIYVLDGAMPGIVKFNAKGDSVATLSGRGTDTYEFDSPQDIDASLGNFVAVADYGNHRVQMFSRELLWQFGFQGIRGPTASRLFAYPKAVSMSSGGICYLIDGEGKRIVKVLPQSSDVQTLGTTGTNSALLSDPISLVLDKDDRIAALNSDGRVVVITNFGDIAHVAEVTAATKLSRMENDLLVVIPASNDLLRCSFSDLKVTGGYHLANVASAIRDVAYAGNVLYVLTQKNVLVCSTSK
jgi:hypothetical protein